MKEKYNKDLIIKSRPHCTVPCKGCGAEAHSHCVTKGAEQMLCVQGAKSLQLCLTLHDAMDCSPPGSSVHGDSPVKNTGVGCHALLQGIFLTQVSNPCLLCLLNWHVGSLLPAPPGRLPPLTHLLISSRNTFTDTPRITFSQISGLSFSQSVNT